jgi:hypothetical protein
MIDGLRFTRTDLDKAVAILLDLLRNGRAGGYGYDLYARELERKLRFDSDILMSITQTSRLESFRRYSSRQLGSCAGAELFGPGSEGRANKLSRKAVIH